MAPTTRTRMTAAQRREQLLDTTRALVDDEGFHAVSIDAVRAGRASPAPSSTTTSRRSRRCSTPRWTARRERALGQLAAALPAPGAATDRRELLLARLEGYLGVVRADPVTWRLVLMPPEGAPASLRKRITAGRRAIVAELADVLRPCAAPRARRRTRS